MTLRKYWGAEEGGRNWLLGFKSISLAKHKPEEMGSSLCAFTVVCCLCCCWELTWSETTCLYMAPECTLSALTEKDRGPAWPTVTHLSDRKKTFCQTNKNTIHHSAHRKRSEAAKKKEKHSRSTDTHMEETVVRAVVWDKPTVLMLY